MAARGRGSQTLVMTVELQANAKGLDSTFNLAEGHAKELANAITSAFGFKTDNAVAEMAKFAKAKDALIENVKLLQSTLNSAFSFKTQNAIKEIKSVRTEINALNTRVVVLQRNLDGVNDTLAKIAKTAQSLKNIKLNVQYTEPKAPRTRGSTQQQTVYQEAPNIYRKSESSVTTPTNISINAPVKMLIAGPVQLQIAASSSAGLAAGPRLVGQGNVYTPQPAQLTTRQPYGLLGTGTPQTTGRAIPLSGNVLASNSGILLQGTPNDPVRQMEKIRAGLQEIVSINNSVGKNAWSTLSSQIESATRSTIVYGTQAKRQMEEEIRLSNIRANLLNNHGRQQAQQAQQYPAAWRSYLSMLKEEVVWQAKRVAAAYEVWKANQRANEAQAEATRRAQNQQFRQGVGSAVRFGGELASGIGIGTYNVATSVYDKAVAGIGRIKGAFSGLTTGAETASKSVMGWFDRITTNAAETGQKTQGIFSRFFRASFFADIAANMVTSMISRFKQLSVETVIYAARTEELGVALSSLARVNDISTKAITEQEVAIKRLNITTQDTRETLARFINVGFNINDASPLARVAQDLAVIGNKSTSEELNQLVIAIQTLQSRNLRSAGVFLTVDEILDKLSATTGRARDSFSTLEKQQAVLSAVLEYGAKVSGTYDAAMETVSKRMRSLERNFREAQNAVGTAFIPVLGAAVDTATWFLQVIQQYPAAFTALMPMITSLTVALIALRTQAIQGLVVGLYALTDVAKTGLNAAFGLNLNTQQAARNALLLEETTIQLNNLRLQEAKSIMQIQELRNEVRLAELGTTRNSIERQRIATLELELALNQQITRQKAIQVAEQQVARGGAPIPAAGSGVAGFLGKAGLFAAALATVYEIASVVKSIYDAPRPLTNLDTSAAAKNAEDINKLTEYRTELTRITTGELQNQTQVTNQLEETFSALDVTLQARLNTELGINRAGIDRITLAKAELAVLDQQREILEATRKAKITEGVTNLEAAVANYDKARLSVENYSYALNKVAQERKKTGSVGYYERYFTGSQSTNAGAPVMMLGEMLASHFAPEGYSLKAANDGGDRAASNFDFIKTKAAEANKSLDEFAATVTSAAVDLEKLGKAYGETNTDKFILQQYAVSDAFKESVLSGTQFTGTMTEQEKTAYSLIDALERLRAKQAQEATRLASTDLAGRFSVLGGSYSTERDKFVKNTLKEIDKRENQAALEGKSGRYFSLDNGVKTYTAEANQMIENSKKLFDSGLVAKESFDQYKKDIQQLITSDFVTGFAKNIDGITEKTITTGDVVAKVNQVQSDAIKERDALLAKGINTLTDEEKATLKNAEGKDTLITAMRNYASTAQITQTVNEGLELSFLKMSQALFEATKGYDNLFLKSQKFIEDDIQARKLSEITSLGNQIETLAGETGNYNAESIKSFFDVNKGKTPEEQLQNFRKVVRQLTKEKSVIDLDEQIKGLREGKPATLVAKEKELAVQQAIERLREARNPNIELQRIDAQVKLVQDQQKLEQLRNPDAQLKAYEQQGKVVAAQIKLEEARQTKADAQNPELIRLATQTKIVELETQLLELRRATDPTIEKLERQLRVEGDIKKFRDGYKEVEDEIATLKVTTTLPAINAELLGERAILTTIQERKQAQQQLIADIATEISMRRTMNELSLSSLETTQAEVFLERTRAEGTALKDLSKSYFNLQADLGDQSFRDNPLIKQGEEQSKKLDETVKRSDIHILATRRTNELLESTIASRLDQANENSNEIGRYLQLSQQGILNALAGINTAILNSATMSGGGGNYGDYTSNTEKGRLIADTAKRMGMSPATLAGIIDFESSGDPTNVNPWGYAGLIQFSPHLQKKYGVNARTSFADQMPFIERYFREHGYRPGMSDLQAYATVLGGSPNANLNRTDANGTSPLSGIMAQRRRMGQVLKRYGLTRTGTLTEAPSTVAINPVSPTTVATTTNVTAQTLPDFKSANRVADKNAVQTQYDKVVKKLEEERTSAQEAQARLIEELTNKGLIGNVTTIAQSITEIQNLASPNDVNKLYNINEILESDDFGVSVQEMIDLGNGMAGMVDKFYSFRELIRRNRYRENIETERKRLNTRSLTGLTDISQDIGFTLDEAGRLGSSSAEGFRSRALSVVSSAAFEAKTEAQKEVILNQIKAISQEAQDRAKQSEQLNLKALNAELYSYNLRTKVAEEFYNSTRQQDQDLDKVDEEFNTRRLARLDKTSLYSRNLIRQEEQARRQAREDIEAEIEAQQRLTAVYTGSAQQRADLEREALRDRLKAHNDTIAEITKLEISAANAQIGMQDRLRLKYAQINDDRARSYENNLVKQIELEEALARKFDPYDRDEFRNSALEKLISTTKSETELMTDLFNDSFDAISGGFGGLIDSMTEKLGIFGGVLGNQLKGLVNNIMGNLFGDLLNSVAPKNPELEQTQVASEAFAMAMTTSGEQMLSSTTSSVSGLEFFTTQLGTYGNAIVEAAGYIGTSVIQVMDIMLSTVTGGGVTGATTGGGFAGAVGNLGSATFGGGGGLLGATGGIQAIQGLVNTRGGSLTNIGAGNPVRFPSIRAIAPEERASLTGGVGTTLTPNPLATGIQHAVGGQAGGLLGGVVSAASGKGGFLKNLFGKGGIGSSLLTSAPMISATLGGLLGGTGASSTLGQIGGLAGGIAGLGILSSMGLFSSIIGGTAGTAAGGATLGGLFGAGSALGGLFGAGGALQIGALSAGLSATIVLAPIAGALLAGAYIWNKNKKLRADEKLRDQTTRDSLTQLQELLKAVRADKMDGAEALTKAAEIRQQYLDVANQMKTSKTKRIHLKDVSRLDAVIKEIQVAADTQTRRRELDDKIVPTYAMGGVADSSLIRVSRGETLFHPAIAGKMVSAFKKAGIPGVMGSKSSFADGGIATIPGHFDAKDDILVSVPKGTVIATPRQVSRIVEGSYSRGGVVGQVSATAAQAQITVQPPTVNVIVAIGEEEAQKIASRVPGAIIVNNIRKHVRDTGAAGLAGDVLGTFK